MDKLEDIIRFECDYAEGAHPRILEKLAETNLEQTPGYGEDPHSEHARELIRRCCGGGDLDVHFLTGGTQANQTVIAAALRPHQGVVSAETGHINIHESGAIEATGHKVLALPGRDGKLSGAQIRELAESHRRDPTREHTVQPGMVYISHPTENGTVYTREELEALSAACREYGLLLFVDGARLGYGLAAEGNDLGMPDLARLCDAFTVGGTKVGALFGEAVVLTSPELRRDFRYHIKQRGGMLAKGRLLGIQFEALFEDGLYLRLGEQAVRQAERLRDAFASKGYSFLHPSPTNQQFPILPRKALEILSSRYSFSLCEELEGGNTGVRFCTSWATAEAAVDRLIRDIPSMDSLGE